MRRRIAILSGLLAACTAMAAPPVERIADYVDAHHGDAGILVVGELHGTVQTPAAIAALAERLLERGPLTVALEMPRQHQPALDRYLQSEGTSDARRRLLADPFWQRPRERSDGRRSEAMLQMIERLRGLRADGAAIAILAFDDDAFHADGVDRNAAMAERLRAAQAASPQQRMLVLTGNYHARLTPNDQLRDADGKPITMPPPMASRLRDLSPVSIDIGARSGSFWGCGRNCGPQPIGNPAAATTDDAITFDATPDARHGYHLHVRLPVLDPSPPVAID
jgi:hypothetical protein